MKLRKAAGKAPLDLDDPDVSSDECTEYTDSEAEELDGGLWPVDEEGEDGDGDACGDPGLDAAAATHGSGHVHVSASLTGPEDATQRECMFHCNTASGGEEETDEEAEPRSVSAFNPFSLLTSDEEESIDEESSNHDIAGRPGAQGGIPQEAQQVQRSEAVRRRRQRRRQRQRERRRQQTAPRVPAGPATLPLTALLTPASCNVADDGAIGGAGLLAECWLCYGEGRVVGCGASSRTSKSGAEPAGRGHRAGGSCPSCVRSGGAEGDPVAHERACPAADVPACSGGDTSEHEAGGSSVSASTCCPRSCGCGSDAEGCGAAGERASVAEAAEVEELVAPCRVCAGGLRYIHRRCLSRWLEASWAIACPNCRTVYDIAILDAYVVVPSVRSMLLSSLPPGHNPLDAFPSHTQVFFCVGGHVELSMPCGGINAVEVLRRVRLVVDDMTAHGGDGGLDLVNEDGSSVQLNDFNVTSLVVVLPGEPAQRHQTHQQAVRGPRHAGVWGPWEDSEDDYYGDYEDDYDEEDEQEGGPAGRVAFEPAPPAAVRERSFSSATRLMHAEERIHGFVRAMMDWDRLPGRGPAGNPLAMWGPVMFGGVPLPAWDPQEPRQALAVRSSSDRAAQRAEQQRRRADMLAQQRTQQRYAGGSRAHQNMSGPPRGGGNRGR